MAARSKVYGRSPAEIVGSKTVCYEFPGGEVVCVVVPTVRSESSERVCAYRLEVDTSVSVA